MRCSPRPATPGPLTLGRRRGNATTRGSRLCLLAPTRGRSLSSRLAVLPWCHLLGARLPALQPALTTQRHGGGILPTVRIKRWSVAGRFVDQLLRSSFMPVGRLRERSGIVRIERQHVVVRGRHRDAERRRQAPHVTLVVFIPRVPQVVAKLQRRRQAAHRTPADLTLAGKPFMRVLIPSLSV